MYGLKTKRNLQKTPTKNDALNVLSKHICLCRKMIFGTWQNSTLTKSTSL